MKKILLIATLLFSLYSYADCVYGAKDKSSYNVIKTGYGAKILFSGSYGDDFISKMTICAFLRACFQIQHGDQLLTKV